MICYRLKTKNANEHKRLGEKLDKLIIAPALFLSSIIEPKIRLSTIPFWLLRRFMLNADIPAVLA